MTKRAVRALWGALARRLGRRPAPSFARALSDALATAPAAPSVPLHSFHSLHSSADRSH